MTKRYIAEQELPVTIEQLHILMCVHEQGVVCQQEIADILRRDKSSVQRSVVILKENGLIEITKCKSDKRRNLLSLTDLGRDVSARFA